jgi:hypothetical protein
LLKIKKRFESLNPRVDSGPNYPLLNSHPFQETQALHALILTTSHPKPLSTERENLHPPEKSLYRISPLPISQSPERETLPTPQSTERENLHTPEKSLY